MYLQLKNSNTTYSGIVAFYYAHSNHTSASLSTSFVSITEITGEQAQLLQRNTYNAWGVRELLVNNISATYPSFIFDRGYTGHEHLDQFDLINMNGRLFDPVLGRMLSPDNYMQDPTNPQNYNRYSYCLNNPLKYTDTDGENPILIPILIGAALGGYLGGTAAEGWEFNPGKWEWNSDTWIGIGFGATFGAAGGYGFAVGAPALANTAFFSHFGPSGTIAAYTLVGGVAGGAIGYSSGFAGGMLYSGGNVSYSHQSGMLGLEIGSTLGSTLGLLYGGYIEYNEMWDERKESFKKYARSKAPILHDTEIEINSNFGKFGVAQTYPLKDCETGMSFQEFNGYYSKVNFSKLIVRRWAKGKDPLYMTNEYIWHESDHVLENYTGYAEYILNKYGKEKTEYYQEYNIYKNGYARGPWTNASKIFRYMTHYFRLLYP